MNTYFNKFKDKINNSYTSAATKYKYIETYEDRLDAFLRLQLSLNHIKIQTLREEYENNKVHFQCLNVCGETKDEFGKVLWKLSDGRLVRPHLRNGDTCNGWTAETNSNRLYNESSNQLNIPLNSKLKSYGITSMRMNSKECDDSNSTYRQFSQFTSLSKLATIRKSADKENFIADTFIGSICETDGNAITSLKLSSKEYPIRSWAGVNWNTHTPETKLGYYLSDCMLVIDIDCGNQISKVVAAFESFMYKPQCITIEKGIGKTTKGNASAIFMFDAPLTAEERKNILFILREFLSVKYDLYVIDSKCSGTGYSKNFLKIHKNQLQRDFMFIGDGQSICVNSINLSEFQNWCKSTKRILSPYESDFIYIENKINSVQWKHRNLSFTEIANEVFSKNIEENSSSQFKVFESYVPIGFRNDTLIAEMSIAVLQYYNITGSIHTTYSALNDILNKVKHNIKDRYENSDGQMTDHYIKQRIAWVLKKDASDLCSPDTRRSLLKSLLYQRNIMKKYNKSILLQDSDVVCLDIPELKEIQSSIYSKASSQRGASTQVMKCMLYSVSKCNIYIEDLKKVFKGEDINIPMHKPECCSSESWKTFKNIFVTAKLLSRSSYYNSEFNLLTNQNNIEEEKSLWGSSISNNIKLIDSKDYRNYGLYNHAIVSLIKNAIEWAEHHNEFIKFTDIKKSDVEKIWKQLYKECGLDINIVSCIISMLRKRSITESVIAKRVSKECYAEIARLMLSNSVNAEQELKEDYRCKGQSIVNILNSIDKTFSKKQISDILQLIIKALKQLCKKHSDIKIKINKLIQYLTVNNSIEYCQNIIANTLYVVSANTSDLLTQVA